MASWLEDNKSFILSFLIAFAAILGAFFITQGKAENALNQCEKNKDHIQAMEASQAEVTADVKVIKSRLGYIEKSIDHQTTIQLGTSRRLDELDKLLRLVLKEGRERNVGDTQPNRPGRTQ